MLHWYDGTCACPCLPLLALACPCLPLLALACPSVFAVMDWTGPSDVCARSPPDTGKPCATYKDYQDCPPTRCAFDYDTAANGECLDRGCSDYYEQLDCLNAGCQYIADVGVCYNDTVRRSCSLILLASKSDRWALVICSTKLAPHTNTRQHALRTAARGFQKTAARLIALRR